MAFCSWIRCSVASWVLFTLKRRAERGAGVVNKAGRRRAMSESRYCWWAPISFAILGASFVQGTWL